MMEVRLTRSSKTLVAREVVKMGAKRIKLRERPGVTIRQISNRKIIRDMCCIGFHITKVLKHTCFLHKTRVALAG